ncbi:MAG: sugar ABC transporter substrate-binding protein, partial [Clostridiaceae bacterium]|nr:sugar ABC transporter substrate-binding protein [Clostridiaceae bacterium]
VFENSLPAENVGDHLATVMANYSQVAYESLKQIADLWPGAKVFFAGGTLGMGVTEEYLVGIEEAKNDGIDATVVGDLYSEWTAEGAMNTVLDFIQTDTEFDVVYANCDIMGVGAISALKEAGRFGDIKVHTPGGSPETLDLLKNGEQDATLNIATPAQGGMAFKILYDYVTDGKEPKEKVFFTPLIPVTLENIGDAMDWNDTSKVRELVEDTLN